MKIMKIKTKDRDKKGKFVKGHKQLNHWSGKRHKKESIEKMRIATIRYHRTHDNPFKGKNHTDETKKMLIRTGRLAPHRAYRMILKEVIKLESEGYKCIPIGRVIPDIIAIKRGKIYAIEVEYGKPDYKKYNKDNYKNNFHKVIWIVKNKKYDN